ncbi:MAG TPA: exodeoxyribonuclease VII large subunit [Gemmatimonadales bacterium]|nr:exodeoxyribonuclease VII large subunit [Gemmatimonadales bacterium]
MNGAAPSLPAIGPDQDVWTVSALNGVVRALVEGELGPIWVRGEVLQCKVWSSGHWYFTLRDADAQVRCCMWRAHAAKAGRPPADGTEVFAFGTPGLYEAKGEFQFVVSRLIATDAMGAQQRELERVRAALQADGLFDPARKRPLPELATRIAVVTSPDGAALRDIITVARKRWPAVELVVVGARVQGDGAEAELVRALGIVNRLDGVDLCIVGRGGGSREDLAVFNSEAVCRALAAVRVPTISAVGHETDVSLTDLVADLRAPTPSAAAEMAVADARELQGRIEGLAVRLAGGLARRSRVLGERLERTADRLTGAMTGLLGERRRLLERLGAQLDALSPLRCLERGYAVARGPDGRLLRRRADFAPGSRFSLRVADGEVDARVEGAS